MEPVYLHVRSGDPLEEPRDWYFTFSVSGPRAGRFVRIHGTYEGARHAMLERYGRAWAFQYRSAEEAGVSQFGLTELRES